ncbi:MAG: SDR family NAD(P)-dependent oxidoreductase [Quisquiliibacterium sp.]
MQDSSLQDAVVAVTGAGQGIGRAIATAFARQGARLVVSDINGDAAQATADALRELGVQAEALRVDVRSPDDNAVQVARAAAKFGRLDVMVCNAGIVQVKHFMDLVPADWDTMMGVNVTGVFLSMQAAARQMLGQAPRMAGAPQGKIINLASIAGRMGAGPIAALMAPYRASKAAVISLTQSAAITLAPKVTVNAICPGIVDTAMWEKIDRDMAEQTGAALGQSWQQRIAAIPMGRPQEPQDVAGVAVFLGSSAADYMTGQSINVEGGLVMS